MGIEFYNQRRRLVCRRAKRSGYIYNMGNLGIIKHKIISIDKKLGELVVNTPCGQITLSYMYCDDGACHYFTTLDEAIDVLFSRLYYSCKNKVDALDRRRTGMAAEIKETRQRLSYLERKLSEFNKSYAEKVRAETWEGETSLSLAKEHVGELVTEIINELADGGHNDQKLY